MINEQVPNEIGREGEAHKRVFADAAALADETGSSARALGAALQMLAVELRKVDPEHAAVLRRGAAVAIAHEDLAALMAEARARIMLVVRMLQ